jgi:hypothetical protein
VGENHFIVVRFIDHEAYKFMTVSIMFVYKWEVPQVELNVTLLAMQTTVVRKRGTALLWNKGTRYRTTAHQMAFVGHTQQHFFPFIPYICSHLLQVWTPVP